jgi:type I restriction enzyme S subunit
MTFEKLGDIALVTPGTSPKGTLINSTRIGLPFFQGSKEFKELYPVPERYTEHPVKVAKSGDVLISVRAPVGEVNIAREDCAIGRGVMSVRAKKESEQLFIFYFLKNLKGEWDSLGSTGSVFENLSTVALNNVNIPVGLNREAIGEILFNIDKKIEANNDLSKTLEDIAQTIFKSWFIDFDPLKAKMAGEKPGGMDDATAALFPDEMGESELGLIPKGWEISQSTDLFDVLGGGTPKTTNENYWNGDIPWFSVVDAPDAGGCFFIKTNKNITKEGLHNSAANLVRPGVAIISARGTVGKTALVAIPSTFNQSCYGIEGKYGDFFTYLLLKNQIVRLQKISHGGMFDTITRETFSAIKVVKPHTEIIEKFESIVSSIFLEIRSLQFQSDNLASLRDSLLPRLISGELQIPEEMLAS